MATVSSPDLGLDDDRRSAQAGRTSSAMSWGLVAYIALLLLIVASIAFRLRHNSQLPMIGWRVILGAVSNSTCALLGCFLVLRRMSLLTDAISHAVPLGIVTVFLLTGSLSSGWMVVGAMVVGVLTTVLTQALSSTDQVAEDSSMGLVYTGLFAIGVILINQYARQAHIDADCVLYGMIDLSTVGIGRWSQLPPGFIRLASVLAATLLFVLLAWKELKIVSFDPALARAMGLPVMLTHYSLMAMAAIASVASFEVVGAILVVAMFIVPAATATLLTDRLNMMVIWAVALAIGSAIFGEIFATMTNSSLPGMMSAVAGVQLACAVFFSSRGGLVARWWQNLQLALRIQREDVLAFLYRRDEAAADANIDESTMSVAKHGWLEKIARWQLRWQKYLELVDGELHLTSAGLQAAQSIVRSHRLWETYLQKHFDLPPDHLHEPAERMEHFINDRLQAELAGELEGETHDPHGRSIPRSDGEKSE